MADERNRTPSEDDGDLSSSFENYSKSLDNNSEALVGNSQSLSENSKFLNKSTEEIKDISKVLQDFAKSFEKEVSKLSDSMEQHSQDIEEAFEEDAESQRSSTDNINSILANSNRNMQNGLTKFQKVTTVAIGLFEIAGRRVISEFSNAAKSIRDAFKADFETITARMQLAADQYQEIWNRSADYFINQGLNKVFTPDQYADKLISALDTGLRGEEAERLAYNTLVANKLVPALQTNSRSYVNMTKQFGQKFDENIIAMSEYSSAILNSAEGQEDGNLNTILDTLSLQIRATSQTEEEATDKLNTIYSQYSSLKEAGLDNLAQEWIQGLHDVVTNAPGEGPTYMQAAGLYTGSQFNTTSASDLQEIFERYVDQISTSSVDTNTAMASAYGRSTEAGLEGAILNNQSLDPAKTAKEIMNGFSADKSYQEAMDRLRDGYYTNKDDQVTNQEKNLVTKYATWTATIPRWENLITDIKSTLSLILGVLSADTIANSISNLGKKFDGFKNLLSKGKDLLSKGFGKVKNLTSTGISKVKDFAGNVGAAKDLLNEGYSFNEVASVGGKGATTLGKISQIASKPIGSNGLTVGGAAMGGAMLSGGLIMGGIDAYNSGSKAAADGASGAEIAGQSIRGFFTGGEYMSQSEQAEAGKAALAGEKRSIDWGKVAGNAGKGALIGGGAGTFIGGPVGTAVGGAIGAVVGGVANLIDQAVENAKYNELADAVNKYNEALSKSTTAMSNYTQVVNKQKDTTHDLDILNGEVSATESEKLAVLQSLKEEYPQLLSGITDLSDWDESYTEIIQEKIQREKELAKTEAMSSMSEEASALSEKAEKLDNLIGDKMVGKEVVDFAKSFANEDEAFDMSAEDFQARMKEYADKAGVSVDEFAEMANRATNGGLFKWTDEGWVAKDWTWGDNYQQLVESYDENGIKKGTDISDIKQGYDELYSNILTLANQFDEIYRNSVSVDEEGNETLESMRESDKNSVESALQSLAEMAPIYNRTVSAMGDYNAETKTGMIHSDNPMWDTAHKLADSAGISFPSFKVGAYNIQNDGELAELHQGEMVLTSSNADKLRQLGSGGISGLLDGLLSIAGLRATNADNQISTSVMDPVISAIDNQTKVMTSLLGQIIELIRPSSVATIPDVVSPALEGYQGA